LPTASALRSRPFCRTFVLWLGLMLFAGGFLGVCETDVVFLNTTETRQHCPRISTVLYPCLNFESCSLRPQRCRPWSTLPLFASNAPPPHTPHPLPRVRFSPPRAPSRHGCRLRSVAADGECSGNVRRRGQSHAWIGVKREVTATSSRLKVGAFVFFSKSPNLPAAAKHNERRD
jgi:hypothetical protein